MDVASRSASSRVSLSSLLLTVIITWTGLPQVTSACMWTPPPAFCAKTLVVSHGVPRVVLLPAGGTFDVEALVYFDLFDFPMGSGLCPGGPYTVDIEFTLTCTGGAGGTGSATGLPLGNGFNPFIVPVAVAAGPPRLCSLAGTATATLADGMILEAAPRAMPTCIGEPAPGTPSEPRVDLFLKSDLIATVHPGDQASHLYTLVNNDPTESYSGLLTVEMVNTSKMPTASGPMPAGTGVFSLSDPGLGDNFPVGLDHHLFEGCLPLPPDPAGLTTSLVEQPIVLAPGQTLELDVFSRPWGMCRNGSCGQASIVLDGQFSDTDDGLACAGFITAVDTMVPPQYQWLDGGQVAQMQIPANPQAGILPLVAAGLPGQPIQLNLAAQNFQLLVNGQPAPGGFNLFSHPFTGPDHGRTQAQFADGGDPIALPPQQLDLFGHVEVLPPQGAPIQPEIVDLHLIGGPTGFEQTAPGAEIIVGMLPTGLPDFASFFNMTLQLNGIGIDELGEQRDLVFNLVELMPTGPTGFDFHLAGSVAPGTGTEILAVELNLDFHAFGFEAPNPLLFLDRLESGDTSAWTLVVP